MMQLTFAEKIKVLLDVSSSSGFCIGSIFLLIFMAFLFITTNRKNSKKSKKIYIGIYLFLLLIIIMQYYKSLSSMFDYMMNNFFIIFYFPNLAVYLAAIIITNIILWLTIFNFKEDKLLKWINTIVYCILHYFMILILNIVNLNKLDVFDQASIYANKDAGAIISLSSTIFIGWILFITIYKMIRKYQRKNEPIIIQKKKSIKQPVKVPVIPIKEVIKYKKKFPENYENIIVPNELIGTVTTKIEEKPIEPIIIVQNQQPQVIESKIDIEKEEQLKEYESMFTLEDYKKVLEILKSSQINSDNSKQYINNNNTINCTDILKENNEEEIPQPKIEELLNLYKSI